MTILELTIALMIILVAGLIAGAVCKTLNTSLLVGYLLIGAVIGNGGLGLLSQEEAVLESLARFGALLLLFSIGIEFSLEELNRLSRYLLIGGSVQMGLVFVPVAAACLTLDLSWRSAVLIAAAAALSSTVLVFKALSEWGQSATPHGKRAIGILLFQDIALVPLMLVVPLLTGSEEAVRPTAFLWLTVKSVLFVAAVAVSRVLVARVIVPYLASLRSTELVVLFALTVLGGACFGAYELGLPPAVGALAAGMMLSDNRLSKQMDTLILPYRETFAAVFFVTLGTLLRPGIFLTDALVLTVGLIGIFVIKALAAGVALRFTGLSWRGALGMGLGLAQLGEFSFVLLAEGLSQNVISSVNYNRMLFIALGTLIVTPQLLKLGLRLTGDESGADPKGAVPQAAAPVRHAVVVGAGPIGRQIVSRLELMGINVTLIDLSPVNLYPFAQQGFHTIPGDARDPAVLRRASLMHCRLMVISVPDDMIANQIVRAARETNPSTKIVVRCRFLENTSSARKAGADAVVSEEAEASGALLRMCEQIVQESARQAGVEVVAEPGPQQQSR